MNVKKTNLQFWLCLAWVCRPWIEEHRFRVTDNETLRGSFGPRGRRITWENGVMRTKKIYTLHQVFLGWYNEVLWDGLVKYHLQERRKINKKYVLKFWRDEKLWKNVVQVGWWRIKKYGVTKWTGPISLRTGAHGGIFRHGVEPSCSTKSEEACLLTG
jgi:hypothetical protein